MRERDAELYRKYGDELVRFATVLVGPALAEDIVAEAVLRSFAAPAWPTVERPRAYLYRATLNQARQVCRADRRRTKREVLTAPAGTDHGEPHVRLEVLDAMRRLSPRRRAVVYLTYWHDLDCRRVADVLGVSTRTVERELTVARRTLEVLLHD